MWPSAYGLERPPEIPAKRRFMGSCTLIFGCRAYVSGSAVRHRTATICFMMGLRQGACLT